MIGCGNNQRRSRGRTPETVVLPINLNEEEGEEETKLPQPSMRENWTYMSLALVT